MCEWKKCPDAEAAERDAARAWKRLEELRDAVEDHRRGIRADGDLYEIIDRDRILSRVAPLAA